MEKETRLDQQFLYDREEKKLPYQKPRLICFGSIGELTAAGAGSRTEQATGYGGCSQDPHRRPCN
jgi:hypothetical protein